MSKQGIKILVLLSVILPAVSAEAGIVKNIRVGLGVMGFSSQLQKDIFADGWKLNFGQNFVDKEYDFGNSQLTVNGVLSGELSMSKRGIDEIEFNLDSGNGLAFDFLEFDGVNKMQVQNGLADINQKLTINRLGFYNLELTGSIRGTLVSDDPLALNEPLDLDVGPINIHGQWLIDVINAIFGERVLPGGMADTMVMGWSEKKSIIIDNTSVPSPEGMTIQNVPEPVTIIMMLAGFFMIFRTRRRRLS